MSLCAFVENWLLIAQDPSITKTCESVTTWNTDILLLQTRRDTELKHGTTETKGVGWTWEKARIEETSTHSTFSRLFTRLLVDRVANCFVVLLPFSNFVFLDLSHLKYPNPRFTESDKKPQYYVKNSVQQNGGCRRRFPCSMKLERVPQRWPRTHLWWVHLQTTPCVELRSAVSRMKWFYIL